MNLEQVPSNRAKSVNRAVSPVIGVILMVAITVILAAVIGTFVINISQEAGDSAPHVSIGASDHSDSFDATVNGTKMFLVNHNGGETIALDSILIQIRYNSNNSLVDEWDAPESKNPTNNDDYDAWLQVNGVNATAGDSLGTGDRMLIKYNTSGSGTDGTYADKTDYRIMIVDKASDKSIVDTVVKLD